LRLLGAHHYARRSLDNRSLSSLLSYEEARPLLQLFDEELPAELKGKSAEAQAAAWPAWVEAQDAAVRARLRRGDEDTLVNFLLFGVSFTKPAASDGAGTLGRA